MDQIQQKLNKVTKWEEIVKWIKMWRQKLAIIIIIITNWVNWVNWIIIIKLRVGLIEIIIDKENNMYNIMFGKIIEKCLL